MKLYQSPLQLINPYPAPYPSIGVQVELSAYTIVMNFSPITLNELNAYGTAIQAPSSDFFFISRAAPTMFPLVIIPTFRNGNFIMFTHKNAQNVLLRVLSY
jgi:hypothetical protein